MSRRLPPQQWQLAWQQALYGPNGFYRRPEGPAGHFRTAAHAAAPELATALHRLARGERLTAIVDVGAGRGELLTALAELADADRLRLHGVDVVPRPSGLPAAVGWTQVAAESDVGIPDRALGDALVIGWELLDVVPCPILELDQDGVPRVVLVEPLSGAEVLGEPADQSALDWCLKWWPLRAADPGDRIEVGLTRDQYWSRLVHRAIGAGAGAMLAVDYAHRRQDRPPLGSLTGFQAGRAVPAKPDSVSDLTAHVALDAVAAAGLAAGAADSMLSEQHLELRALGVREPELLDPGGLGGFGWLFQRLGSD